MPNIFELCSTEHDLKRNNITKELLLKEKEDILKREQDERDERHRKSHIFSSYEDALNYLESNPGQYITWHCDYITFIPEENLFRSNEQRYSCDGVIPYNVTCKYTHEELLENILLHIERLKEKGYDTSELYDQWGKLNYVYTH